MVFFLEPHPQIKKSRTYSIKCTNYGQNRLIKLQSEGDVLKNHSFSFQDPLKVLVIEDNQVDRKMLESMLTESEDFTSFIKITDTLKDGIDMLDQHEFDVVLLDLNLPDSEGVNTITDLIAVNSRIAIVINTGAYEDELGLKALSLGAQDFLIKGKYNAYVLNKVLHYAVERKRLEHRIIDTDNKLDSANKQLIQAEKMQVVGTLASGVAHEVKNPLATILYGVTYLSDHAKIDDQNAEEVLKNIKDATNRANEIITDLLDFSSLSKIKLKNEEIYVVIDKVLALVKHQLDKYHVQVNVQKNDDLPLVQMDSNRIEQVLVNLVLNSIFAMDGGGQININTKHATLSDDLNELPNPGKNSFQPGENIVILNVEDNGSGIPEDKLEHIFEPFFTTRRTSGGVGLGLSVCHNIMEIHGGDIVINNKPDGGARATLVFRA